MQSEENIRLKTEFFKGYLEGIRFCNRNDSAYWDTEINKTEGVIKNNEWILSTPVEDANESKEILNFYGGRYDRTLKIVREHCSSCSANSVCKTCTWFPLKRLYTTIE